MAFQVNWQLTGDVGGGASPQTGSIQSDAVERLSVVVPAASTDAINTAVLDTAALRLLVIALGRYTDVTLQVGAGPALTPEGPAIIDGTWAQLLGATAPSAITVTNNGADDLAVEMLICRDA